MGVLVVLRTVECTVQTVLHGRPARVHSFFLKITKSTLGGVQSSALFIFTNQELQFYSKNVEWKSEFSLTG
jgi:hypothetical protein